MKLNYKISKGEKKEEILLSFDGDILGEESDLSGLNVSVKNEIENGAMFCTINLSKVMYMDSSGLGILIMILTKFRNIGGEVYLEAISEPVQKLLLITKLNSIFEVK